MGTSKVYYVKEKRRGENKMEWEETDTLVHFYEDQDGKLYIRLPGGNIRRVKKEKEESLRKSLKKIGYQPQPIPIQTHKTPQTTKKER